VSTAAADAAARAAARLTGGAGVRACALFDRDGELLAASGDNDWTTQAQRIWEAAADGSYPAPAHVHVATDGGEVFAVRGARTAIVAVTDRFALASLVLCDLRAALRGFESR
jgi:hypothetical protein